MQECALPLHLDEAFSLEFVEVVRQSGIRDVQFFLNLADDETLGVGGQEQLHDPKPGFGPDCGEHIRVPRYLLSSFPDVGSRHISIIAETWIRVKRADSWAEMKDAGAETSFSHRLRHSGQDMENDRERYLVQYNELLNPPRPFGLRPGKPKRARHR
jgi:hypothetical protein